MITNHSFPVEPVEAPTSDEREILLETARAAQVAGTFPSDSAIRLLTDDYGWNESERRHCMAAARLALAYWGHAWGCLTTNHPAPAKPVRVERLPDGKPYPTPPAEGEAGGLVADLEVAAASYFNRGFVTDAKRCRRAADLLQQQAAELAMLRQLAEEILALVSESDGVAGLHLNGDIAPWDELLPGGRFERLTALPLEDRPHG